MSERFRTIIFWSYVIATKITFLGFLTVTVFEVYVRWTINQDFTALGPNGFLALAILLAAQMFGLIRLLRAA